MTTAGKKVKAPKEPDWDSWVSPLFPGSSSIMEEYLKPDLYDRMRALKFELYLKARELSKWYPGGAKMLFDVVEKIPHERPIRNVAELLARDRSRRITTTP